MRRRAGRERAAEFIREEPGTVRSSSNADGANVAKSSIKVSANARVRSSSKYDLREYFSGPGAPFYSIRIGSQLWGLSTAVGFECECITPAQYPLTHTNWVFFVLFCVCNDITI